MKPTKLAIVLLLAVLVAVLFSACSRAAASNVAPTSPPLARPATPEVVKPKPIVLGVNATTSGMFDNYYAILDVAVRNDGADGMVILIGSVNQANVTTKTELPVYLAQNVTETVRVVLPLKWRGGDWTPSAVTDVP